MGLTPPGHFRTTCGQAIFSGSSETRLEIGEPSMDLVRIVQILVLAVVQGLAELLPVSSSAHVTVVARLIGYDLGSDPSAELRWAFLLIMLHTGTMFSVLLYFWSRWKPLLKQIPALIAATAVTATVALALKTAMEKASGQPIEDCFRSLPIIAASLAAV